MPPTSGDRECVTYAEGSTSVRLSLSGRRLAVESSDKKNVHRAGRVAGGLLNPSGRARLPTQDHVRFRTQNNPTQYQFREPQRNSPQPFPKQFIAPKRLPLTVP